MVPTTDNHNYNMSLIFYKHLKQWIFTSNIKLWFLIGIFSVYILIRSAKIWRSYFWITQNKLRVLKSTINQIPLVFLIIIRFICQWRSRNRKDMKGQTKYENFAHDHLKWIYLKRNCYLTVTEMFTSNLCRSIHQLQPLGLKIYSIRFTANIEQTLKTSLLFVSSSSSSGTTCTLIGK